MDAITLLKDDHKSVKALFRKYEKAGDRAYVQKRRIVDDIIGELSVHAAIEEQLFYPVARATVPGVEEDTLQSIEEHHVAKWVLSELEGMEAEAERFDAKVRVLIDSVRRHIEEEEGDLFPQVRDELGRNALGDLGDALEEAKKTAPTHPHPEAPDEPPANVGAGNAAGVVDRIEDTVGGVAQGGVMALQDLIARVTDRKKPRAAPTGAKRTRSTASKVRERAAEVTDEIADTIDEARRTGKKAVSRTRRKGEQAVEGTERTAKSAGRGAKRTASAAKSGAKGTATSARKSTKKAAGRTSSTAKRAATTTGRTAKKAAKSTKRTAKRNS